MSGPVAPRPAPPAPEGEARSATRSKRGFAWWHALLLAYCAALAVSWMVSQPWGPADPPEVPSGRSSTALPEFNASGAPTGRKEPVQLAYRDSGLAAGPVILMLHGSPGTSHDFRSLTPRLSDRFRIISPDLPGFGASSRHVADYSARAHAAYALALMDELGVERFHCVGFSMGGAVSLEIVDLAPARVQSITFLAAMGVEEFELLGTYPLNHGLHGFQLACLRGLRWLTPHFGALEESMLSVEYARNFYDTDQRRLRPILEEYDGPFLVYHGAQDFLVPEAAAREHGRIVPQAEVVILEERSHFLPWTEPDKAAAAIAGIVRRADAGEATLRASADPKRLAEAALPFDPKGIPPFEGPALVAILLILAVGTLVSEDLACIAGGLLVADGRLPFVAASLACFVGIYLGDMLLYALGRLFGQPALARRPLVWIVSESAVERASRWFERKGIAVIFLSRLTPGLRLPTYVAAGILRTRFRTFAFFFAVAGIVWTPALVGVAALAGERLADAIGGLGPRQLPWVLLLVVGLFQFYSVLPLLFTHRGRRLLRGKWLRVRRWEFWPPWLTYLPVLAWILWLAVRHGGLTKVTAANPAMPAGGLVDESKSEILDALDADQPDIASFVLLRATDDPEFRARAAADFMAREGASYPVIVKPDAGQRGSGVRSARDAGHLEEIAREVAIDSIVQVRVDGPEFGIFYTRAPGEAKGTIFSITAKELPQVVGDGERTTDELVLDDPRACILHSAYMAELGPRADDIPAAGEVVRLVEVGTHARGAIFLDGAALKTPELEDAIDRIAKRYDGFYFGRFDLRAPSEGHLSRGEGFGIIELNGITSESTEIYDPKHSVFYVYRVLFRQWSRAYEIGAANARAGAPTTSLLRILGDWNRYRARQKSHGR